jgi:hypothetical protein
VASAAADGALRRPIIAVDDTAPRNRAVDRPLCADDDTAAGDGTVDRSLRALDDTAPRDGALDWRGNGRRRAIVAATAPLYPRARNRRGKPAAVLEDVP